MGNLGQLCQWRRGATASVHSLLHPERRSRGIKEKQKSVRRNQIVPNNIQENTTKNQKHPGVKKEIGKEDGS